MILLVALLACGPKEVDSGDPAEEIVTYPPVSGDPCDELILDIDGNDPPIVGDTWRVWLYCDEALLTGTMLLQFTPPELASVEDNLATFLASGTGTMRMQVGSKWQEREVEVAVAE